MPPSTSIGPEVHPLIVDAPNHDLEVEKVSYILPVVIWEMTLGGALIPEAGRYGAADAQLFKDRLEHSLYLMYHTLTQHRKQRLAKPCV